MQRDGCWNARVISLFGWLHLCLGHCKDPRPWTAARIRGGVQVKNVPVRTHSILPTLSALRGINMLRKQSTITLNNRNNSMTNNSANDKTKKKARGQVKNFLWAFLYLYLSLQSWLSDLPPYGLAHVLEYVNAKTMNSTAAPKKNRSWRGKQQEDNCTNTADRRLKSSK